MSTTKTRPGSVPEAPEADGLTNTARTTGLLYAGLAVTGALGFLLVRGQLGGAALRAVPKAFFAEIVS